jgi:hypothetical protein
VTAPAGTPLRLQIYSSNCADVVHACCLQLDLLTLQLQVLAFALDASATRTALSVVPQSTVRSSSSGPMQAPFAAYNGEARGSICSSSSVVVVAPQGDSSSEVSWLAQQLLARRSSSAVTTQQLQQQQPVQAALREAQRCVKAVCSRVQALLSKGTVHKQQPPLSSAYVRDAMWAAEVCAICLYMCIYNTRSVLHEQLRKRVCVSLGRKNSLLLSKCDISHTRSGRARSCAEQTLRVITIISY